LEGLAVTRAIHDRYHASRRNPYNEVECSDHYSRSMASYGSFLAICGFEYHGPRGHLGFAPRITPEHFRAPFTVAEGWGIFSQQATGRSMGAYIALKYGRLRLNSLALSPPRGAAAGPIKVMLGEKPIAATHKADSEGRLQIAFTHPMTIAAGQTLSVQIGEV